MADGTVQPEVQPHDQATHAPKCDKEQAMLDWNEPATVLQRKIRAFNPAPGAATFLHADRVKLLRARVSEDFLKSGRPGEILAIIETGIIVQTGEGALEISSLQPAGKREMPARDWARGHFKDAQLGQFTQSPAQAQAEHLQNSGI
jgi:methionyl-tRNA formyltransferase